MTHDPTDLRSLEREQAKRDTQRKLDGKTEADDVKWLMGGKRGRRIIWRLLEQSGVFRLSFDANSMRMAFNEGNRNFGNRTLTMIHTHCPELYATMVRENANERNESGDGTGSDDHS